MQMANMINMSHDEIMYFIYSEQFEKKSVE